MDYIEKGAQFAMGIFWTLLFLSLFVTFEITPKKDEKDEKGKEAKEER